MQSVQSVCPSVHEFCFLCLCAISFEPADRSPWFFARVWIMTIGRKRLKLNRELNVILQGRRPRSMCVLHKILKRSMAVLGAWKPLLCAEIPKFFTGVRIHRFTSFFNNGRNWCRISGHWPKGRVAYWWQKKTRKLYFRKDYRAMRRQK